MKKEEYIKTIKLKNGLKIDIGLDDYAQAYFIEYLDKSGVLKEECCGTYNPWQIYILDRFGEKYEE